MNNCVCYYENFEFLEFIEFGISSIIQQQKSSKQVENILNGKIKKHFTNRVKYNLVPVFDLFEKVVIKESRRIIQNKGEPVLCAKVTLKLKNLARFKSKLDLVNKLESDEEGLNYLCENKYEVKIYQECFCPDCTYCTCNHFLDQAKCFHL
ncbi:unnamed protein product, partial [Brachionus calyciflorus]